MRCLSPSRLFVLSALTVLSTFLEFGPARADTTFPKSLQTLERESGKRVYDQANLLRVFTENSEHLLEYFFKTFNSEVIVITIPSLEGQPIELVASALYTRLNIGRDASAKGILLLISRDERLVKMEVGYGSESIFTDLFCGYIERKQLKPYVENNQLDAGLAATFEEFISRAAGKLDDQKIQERLKGDLSGGAGITKPLSLGETKKSPLPSSSDRTFYSPEDVWAGYVDDLRNCKVSLDLYTPLSQMVWEYARGMNKEICAFLYAGHSGPAQFIRNQSHAVAYVPTAMKLGARFLVKTDEGWKLDIWSTRKWIHFDFGQNWKLLGRNHPYMFAFKDSPLSPYFLDYGSNDDFTFLAPGLLKSVPQTREGYLGLVQKLEAAVNANPDSIETIISLAEVYFDLGAEFKASENFQKALALNPNEPRALKGLGLLNRDVLASTDTAISYLRRYVEVAPEKPEGHYYLAIAYWRRAGAGRERENSFRNALAEMERYIELVPPEDRSNGKRMANLFAERLKDKGK